MFVYTGSGAYGCLQDVLSVDFVLLFSNILTGAVIFLSNFIWLILVVHIQILILELVIILILILLLLLIITF
jgi:hypothetical protein